MWVLRFWERSWHLGRKEAHQSEEGFDLVFDNGVSMVALRASFPWVCRKTSMVYFV